MKSKTALQLLLEGCIAGLIGFGVGGGLGVLCVPRTPEQNKMVTMSRNINTGYEVMVPKGFYDTIEYGLEGAVLGNGIGLVGYYGVVLLGWGRGGRKKGKDDLCGGCGGCDFNGI